MHPPSAPRIVATTERWWVACKPAGWLTIPGRASHSEAGRAAFANPVIKEWLERETGEKVWVVHRIDRETSGLLLFARSAEAHRLACSWFEKHQVKKTYDLLAMGSPGSPLMRIADPIEGVPATTLVEVKERFQGIFLGRATPQTGRRHQIRIHLAGRGHPLAGDSRYGGPARIESESGLLEISRVALHAARLELPGGESYRAAWPADFEQWLRELRS